VRKHASTGKHLNDALKNEVDRADGNAIAAKELAGDLRDLREELAAAGKEVTSKDKEVELVTAKLSLVEKALEARRAQSTIHARESVERLHVHIRRHELSEWTIVLVSIVHVLMTAWAAVGGNLYYPRYEELTSIVSWVNMAPQTVLRWIPITCPMWSHRLVLVASAALCIWWVLVYLDRRCIWRVFSTYRVRFLRWADREDYPDLRADVNALQDMKHANPLYCWVEYSSLTVQGTALISAELLAQLSTTKYQDPLMDYDTAKFKIMNAVATCQGVNIDRYSPFRGSNIALDTVVVALALWRQSKDAFEEMGFGLRPC